MYTAGRGITAEVAKVSVQNGNVEKCEKRKPGAIECREEHRNETRVCGTRTRKETGEMMYNVAVVGAFSRTLGSNQRRKSGR